MNVTLVIQNITTPGTVEFNLLLVFIPIIFTIITYLIFEKNKFIIIDKLKNKKRILKFVNDTLDKIIYSNIELERQFKKVTQDGHVENSGKCLEEIQKLHESIIELMKFYRSNNLYITRRIENDFLDIKCLTEAEYLILSTIMIDFTVSKEEYAKNVKEVLKYTDKKRVMDYSDKIDSKKHADTVSKANKIFMKIKTKYENKFRRLLKIRRLLG